MYKIVKDKGTTSNVFLMNTDNGGMLNVGRVSMEVVSALASMGVEIQTYDKPDGLPTRDAWDIPDVPEEAKAKFEKIAMPMRKPVRKQKSEQPKQIDAMDVLLGRAHYKN